MVIIRDLVSVSYTHLTDYIIEFLVSKGITDIFGYPGGVICHLMDSSTQYPAITAHVNLSLIHISHVFQ